MADYRYNFDRIDCIEGEGLSYNQLLDLTDVESSGEILTESVTLDEVKNFCKIDINESEENALIQSLITAARLMCEEYSNILFIKRPVVAVINNGNGGFFLTGPVGEIISITDMEGNTIPVENYKLSGSLWKQLIYPRLHNIVITYYAGHEVLPENLKTALLNAVYFLYDNRSQGTDNIGPIAMTLLNPVRRVW